MFCAGGGCSPPKIEVLVIGAFSSGKTTILQRLGGKLRRNCDTDVATLGLREDSIQLEEFKVNFLDIGGEAELLLEWPSFYGHVHGFIYTLDTTDLKHAEFNGQHLFEILGHADVDGKPFLIVATKSDSPKAMKEETLFDVFDLENVLSRNRNAQLCYAEDMPHWIHDQRPSSEVDSAIIAAKRNISYNTLQEEEPCPAELSKAFVHMNVETFSTYSRESIIVEFMGLHQGVLWLLEFIDSNRQELNRRIAVANKENNVARKKRRLIQIQRKWERQCAKNLLKTTRNLASGTSHGGLAHANSQIIRAEISQLNMVN